MAWIRENRGQLEIDTSAFVKELEVARSKSKVKLKKAAVETKLEPEVDDTDSLILKAGNQYFKLVAVKEDSSIEGLLKENYEKRLKEETEKLQHECHKAVDEFKAYGNTLIEQASHEIRQIKERLQDAAPMPEIGFNHAQQGLTVVKGTRGGLYWLFRTVYAPQFYVYDRKSQPINPTVVKRMMRPMIILVETKGNQVLGVSTRTPDLEKFRHYHRHHSGSRATRRRGRLTPAREPGEDCWGNWVPSSRWQTADDILRIAKEAVGVLTTINGASLASQNPTGLPTIQKVRDSLMGVATATPEVQMTRAQQQEGLDTTIRQRGGWTLRDSNDPPF